MRKISLTLIIFLIIILSIILIHPNDEKEIMNTKDENKNNMLSIMVESEAGTWNYIDASNFPGTGYYLNKNLSKCVNGSKISFSDGNLIVKGNKSDRCYAYFDKDELGSICRDQNMAECFAKNYKKDSSIIYHDGKCDYEEEENCDLEAGDLSYRYTGGNDVVYNYVCLNNNDNGNCDHEDLYRIIGLFKNEEENYEIKLIKADYTTAEETGDKGIGTSTGTYKNQDKMAYTWSDVDTDNNFATSRLNTINLNQIFYNYITKKYSYLKNIITNHNWYIAGLFGLGNAKVIYEYELGIIPPTGNYPVEPQSIYTNIGLMYVSDYMYGVESLYWSKVGLDSETFDDYRKTIEYNWIYNGLHENTISRLPSSNTGFYGISSVGVPCSYGIVQDNAFAIRPTFYLNANTLLISGNGKENNPYRLKI